jgi:hypothetical protein
MEVNRATNELNIKYRYKLEKNSFNDERQFVKDQHKAIVSLAIETADCLLRQLFSDFLNDFVTFWLDMKPI